MTHRTPRTAARFEIANHPGPMLKATQRPAMAFRGAAADLRSDLHFARLDGSWDLTRAAEFLRTLGEKIDGLVFALQDLVDADVIPSPEPFGEFTGAIAVALERKAARDERQSREDCEQPVWSATLEKFV